MPTDTDTEAPKDTRFQKGQSGNPRGRPPGARNRSTLLYRELLDAEGTAVLKRTITSAKKGNKVAMRLIIERLVPPAKSGTAALDLPVMQQACDVAEAAQEVIAAAARGDLTLSEAREWMSLIDRQRVTIETRDLAVRLEVLEEEERQRARLDRGGKRS
jgi:hypothetical protein